MCVFVQNTSNYVWQMPPLIMGHISTDLNLGSCDLGHISRVLEFMAVSWKRGGFISNLTSLMYFYLMDIIS